MPSKDPPNPADMHKVYISEAKCDSHLLHTSKRYRLHFTIESPDTITGPRSPKSEYIEATHDAVVWKDPFGDEFTVNATPIDCRVAIELRKRRFGRSGWIVASCSLDLSSTGGKEIRLDLKDNANDKFGELTICVASSVVSTGGTVQNPSRAGEQLGPGLPTINALVVTGEAVQNAGQTSEQLGPGQPTANDLVSTVEAVRIAGQAVEQLGSGLPAVNDAIQTIAPLATQLTAQFNAWQPLLSRLGALVKVADAVAEVHPWIKLAWGIVSAAYKIPAVQSERDAKVMHLVQTMTDSCSFAEEAEELKKRSKRDQDIINQILHQVMECTNFIRDYCKDKSFVKRTVKYTVSLVDGQIDKYKGTFETLQRNLIDHASIQCSVITHRVLDVVNEVRDLQVLSEIKYAPEAGDSLDKGCLPGTRTEIIDAVVRWAVGADTPAVDSNGSIPLSSKESSRVLWLCGLAGAGKSSILRSCAKRVSDLERMGSYYGFNKNKPLANLTNLFSTIALDLADLDNSRKQRLVDAVKNETAIRRSLDCMLQFKHLIIRSFEDDKAVGETVVFIDAFDESGDAEARADALSILTKRAPELPPGLRVVVTSRYEPDIQDALRSPLPPGVDLVVMDHIPTYQTSRDIATYIHSELSNVIEFRMEEHKDKSKKQIGALIEKAETSFQWAATACRFIRRRYAGVDPWGRLQKMLDADKELYGLYGDIMKEHCDPSDEEAVERVKSILGRIISAREPLSLHALVHLVPANSIFTPGDIQIQRQIVQSLGTLLSGTHSDDEPIVPLHSSYRDFLCDPNHKQEFYIDKGEANQDMGLACFRVMDQTLTFNICQIPTSFLRNVAIPNIKALVEKYIPSHLYYACQFWGFHMSTMPRGEVAHKPLESFFHKDFLAWLEVMSLRQSSPQTVLASLSTSDMPLNLVELQHDAMQFISMFSSAIATSMPHIYLSGLTFSPVSSLLYQRWQGQFPGVAKLAQGQLQHWPKIMLSLEGHSGSVRSVAFSPDGKQIASGSEDKTIRLWNMETGASIGQPMEGHHDAILSIAFSPKGKQIASGSLDKTIHLWNVETGASIGQPMEGHGDAIASIAFSPDGKQIASGSADKTIQLWNVETGATIGQPMVGHDDAILSIAFSPDGKQIASGSLDKTIRLWSVEMGASIGQPMEGHHEAVLSIAFSPDGKQIASGSQDKTIRLWSVEMGASIGQPMEGHHSVICSIAFSPDGKQIASGSWDRTIRLWNAKTSESIGQPMEGHGDAVFHIAFSPDGKQIASGSADKTIQLWNVETGVSIGQPVAPHHDSNPYSDADSDANSNSDSDPNFSSHSDANSDVNSNSDSDSNSDSNPNPNPNPNPDSDPDSDSDSNYDYDNDYDCEATFSIAFSPDGKQIASSSLKTVQLWNVETGAGIGQPMEGHGATVRSIAFSPDGKQIASGSADKTIQLWNVETGLGIGQPMKGHSGTVRSIAFSPDGKQIASGSLDKTIQLWNVETGISIGQPMVGHDDAILSIAFSPDGKQIASGSQDKTIRLWNVETHTSIGQPMVGHDESIISIAFSPDGKLIASGSLDETMHLWNVETGISIVQPMEETHGPILCIAFSPDGKQIVSGSQGKIIQLWNVETGDGMGQPVEEHHAPIVPITFSPDGKQIASGTPENPVKVSWSPTAESEHSLQYPVNLFPLPPSPFQLDDGWILGPSDELILWVPAAYRGFLEHPHCRIMGTPNNTQIDFQHLQCGMDWVQCKELVGGAQDAADFRDL